MMPDFIAQIVEKCGDYRREEGFDFNEDHVAEWVEQFPSEQREAILSCVSTALNVSYFSRTEAEAWLDRLIENTDFAGPDPAVFWRNANFLNIQKMGRSQREMLVLLDARLQAHFGFSIKECGAPQGVYIYLDDGRFSGGHVIKDLSDWIASEAPKSADLRVVTVVSYQSGEYRSKVKLAECIEATGKKINLSQWRSLGLENRLYKKNTADVFWPKSIPAGAQHYFDTFTHELEFREGALLSSKEVFVDDIVRGISEEAFVEKGVWIRDQCAGLNRFQRPLGNYLLETAGFGATFVTFRNCPNNAPLVFWAGQPWYPLFPRETNSDTALISAFEGLWE